MNVAASFTSLNDNRIIALDGLGPWALGRDDGAQIRFNDSRCSRLQALLTRDGESFSFEPLPQSAPVLLNDRPCDGPTVLAHGDVIVFGMTHLVFASVRRDERERTAIRRATDTSFPEPAPQHIPLGPSVILGRQPGPGGVELAHPTVSRRHAEIRQSGRGHAIVDLESANGTFVNGRPVAGIVPLAADDRIDIGPFCFLYADGRLTSTSRQDGVELAAYEVSVEVDEGGQGCRLRLLDRVSVEMRSGEFVCIIGASGSGKSTLMSVLSARRAANGGSVTLNDVDFFANFDALKQDISFVPQNDSLHEELTVRQALDYAARLRLPPDIGAAARAEIVEHAARSVDLAARLDVKIALLSGGQKKRAGLACEILNEPSVLFLDEVTSGLDESTDNEIMHLLRGLADAGMIIVCVTHTLANIGQYCDRVLNMAPGGILAFDGSPADTLAFFGVSRLGEVFDRIQADGAEAWRERFARQCATPTMRQRPPARPPRMERKARQRERSARILRQFPILVERGTRLLLADRRNLVMAAVQSVVIGSLIGLAFQNFGAEAQQTPSTVAILMLLGLAALWIGCNGAAKEIVGELAIYRRERDVNLSTIAYVLAKFVVGGAFTIVQLVIFLVLAGIFADRIPGSIMVQFCLLSLAALLGTAMGLLISATANTRDQANTIVPLALVPQLILSGLLVPNMPGWIDQLAKIGISAYWITETMVSATVRAAGPLKQFDLVQLSRVLHSGRPFDPSTLGEVVRATHSLELGVTLLIAHIIAFLAATYLAMLWHFERR